jgi:hypothetical protein
VSASWFKHNAEAADDIRMMALMEQFDAEAYAFYFIIVERLTREKTRRLPLYAVKAILSRFRKTAEYSAEYFKACLELGLFTADATHFWSDDHVATMSGYDAQLAADRKRKAGDVPPEPDRNLSGSDPEVTRNQSGIDPEPDRKENGNDPEASNSFSSSNSNPNSTKSGKATVARATLTDELAGYQPYVDKYLEQPSDPPASWQTENLYIVGGRRPCKEFRRVWLTPMELATVFKLYAEQVPDCERKGVFRDALQATQSEADSHCIGGKRIETFNAYARLSSWKLQDVLNTRAATKRLVSAVAKREFKGRAA